MENYCEMYVKSFTSSPVSDYVFYSGEGKGIIETTMSS